jgi:hypothetical protein
VGRKLSSSTLATATYYGQRSKKKPPGLIDDQESGFAVVVWSLSILMRFWFPLFFDFCGNNTLEKTVLANSRVFKFAKYTKACRCATSTNDFLLLFLCRSARSRTLERASHTMPAHRAASTRPHRFA